MPLAPPQQSYELAVQLHQAGRLAEAETLYRQILAVQPHHDGALHLLGVIAHQNGRHEMAIDLIRQSIALNPNNVAAYCNLGEAWRATGRLDEAAATFRRALQLNDSVPVIHNNLGIALVAQGLVEEAIAVYRRALHLHPDYAEAHNNLGIALKEQGWPDLAAESYRRALALKPDYAEAHNNLGVLLTERHRTAEALPSLHRSVALQPKNAQALANLANAFADLRQWPEAIAAYRRALELQPDYARAWNNLGMTLTRAGQSQEAVTALQQAIQQKSDYAQAHANLGIAFMDCDRVDDAVDEYQQALALDPRDAKSFNNLGNALKDQDRLDEAIAAYRQSLVHDPHDHQVHSNLILALHFHPALDWPEIAAEHQSWNRQFAHSIKPFPGPYRNERHPERRLRLGYVSPDFRDHVVGRNVWPLLRCHDHDRFEVICYSETIKPDSWTSEFQQRADHWRETADLSDEAFASLIRQDAIDILVDLSQHTADNRLPIFAHRPAPVQVSFAGYPETAGLDAIPYRLSDRWLEGADATRMEIRRSSMCPESATDPQTPISHLRSAEQLFLLDTFWCYVPCGLEIPINDLPARQHGFVTFGSLNKYCKINEPVLRLWARLLRNVPDSRLVLLSSLGSRRSWILEILEHEGIDSQRVEFVGPQRRREYLRLYHRLDVALDPFPYNGHTTTLDALWMGVPVVSLASTLPVSRGGFSQLSNLDLPELVATSEDDYVRIAANLAVSLPRLAELRTTLRSRMEKSVLMDAPHFARQIEFAFRAMWRQWCDEIPATDRSPPNPPSESPEALFAMADTLWAQGRLADSIAAYRRALNLRPDWPEGHLNLGIALRRQGLPDAAAAAYQRALALKPDWPEAFNNLGNALRDQGRLDDASTAYRRAIDLKPGYVEAHNNLAVTLANQGRVDEAIAEFRRSLDLAPDHPEAHINLANALTIQARLDEAVAVYRRALSLQPDHPKAHINLGNALKSQGLLDEAVAAYRRAIQLQPSDPDAHSNLIYTFHFHPGYDRQSIANEHARWNRQFSDPVKTSIRPHHPNRDPERPLRIGYVSPDLRDHVVGRNLLPLFRHQDHHKFEIIAYSGVMQPDEMTAELHRHTGTWRSTVGLSDENLEQTIRQDDIDILVDLSQHTGENRLPLFARHPAPLQVSFAGYPDTAGVEALPYRLTDRWLEAPDATGMEVRHSAFGIRHSSTRPESAADLQSSIFDLRSPEQTFLLDTFWCYDPCGIDVPVNDLPAQTRGTVTFGSLSNFCKVNDPVLSLWARVLRGVQGSRLILLSGSGDHRQRTVAFLEKEGIAAHRVEFVSPQPRRQYLELYHQLDLVLDTFPYNGHTTSLDALWMGSPVISLADERPVSRAGLSQLSNLGLSEFASFSADDFVRAATQLAHDRPRLAALRATLRRRMESSVLMDAAGFARQIEAAFRTMWRHWCAASPPIRTP